MPEFPTWGNPHVPHAGKGKLHDRSNPSGVHPLPRGLRGLGVPYPEGLL